MRNVHPSAAQVAAIAATLERPAEDTDDAGRDHPRHRLLLGLYRPAG